MKSVVLLSGGLDSATVLAQAVKDSEEVIAVHFSYHQPTEKIELEKAISLAIHYDVKLVIKDIHNVIAKGGLTEEGKDFASNPVEESGVSAGYVAFRNLLLLTIAAGVGASRWKEGEIGVWIGAQATDKSAYADCRFDFLKAANRALDLSTDTQTIHLLVPLLMLTKEEVLKKALQLKVPLELTYSCYRPVDGEICGSCSACLERREAFEKLGVEDPVK